MSNWIETFNDIFFLSVLTILAGSFGLAVKHCLKSKCEKFTICYGLLTIDRRVDLEVMEEMENGNVNNLETKSDS